jgi:hypothetical protein
MIGPDPTEPIFRSNTVALWTPQDSLFTADETHQRPFLSRLGLVQSTSPRRFVGRKSALSQTEKNQGEQMFSAPPLTTDMR